jgi:hypothetical protein
MDSHSTEHCTHEERIVSSRVCVWALIAFNARTSTTRKTGKVRAAYRRRGLSHSLSHSLSHMTDGSPEPESGPIVPPAREGHRRRFSEADTQGYVLSARRLILVLPLNAVSTWLVVIPFQSTFLCGFTTANINLQRYH